MGAQYEIPIGASTKSKPSDRHLIIGVYGNPTLKFTTSSSSSLRLLSAITSTDTLTNTSDAAGAGNLPASYTAGLMYEFTGHYRFGIQYSATQWSQYYNDARAGLLSDASQFTLGGEYVANASSYKGKKTRYRGGLSFGSDPRSLGGSQLSSFSITAGMGLPLFIREGGILGMINLGLEYGKLSGAGSLISENYIKLNAGFTLNDGSWFMKRRYQ